MKVGAIAMIDALGFKGIWKRPGISAERILSKLRGLVERTEARLDEPFHTRGNRQGLSENNSNVYEMVRATFLSDTVVVAVANKSLHELTAKIAAERPDLKRPVAPEGYRPLFFEASVIVDAASYVSAVIKLAAESEPVLSFRGAISYGAFEMSEDGRFIVGPAVDDAAENHASAQGAIAWVTPAAHAVLVAPNHITAGGAPPPRHPMPLIQYDVPIKGGDRVSTYAVTPFASCATKEECAAVRQTILDSFTDPNPDVAIKKQETARFLDTALSQWTSEPPPVS
jgi:hypothetical protein